ncbi:3-hydroxyisobutyrate dehydrogenase [Frondihabitans sp. PAMC 28766]|uniref:3-hydroxyisobutyrate dehydrogenase n=1 Tax=Frondihabitans sp. PAMC 28766 TaxID=1795630 RepID=UPI00078DF679|nr:3-hydroxyisobutyrate dehydrogenase [Frondihabitans sp. PAMC 28766]AMM21834.1 3-hydroxyisobutyrate dehydrogenase [Frondihabitans sp. PAMC 28766]
MSTSVAFIGLGNMGRPMAVNLAAAGYDVTGFDVFEGARDAAAAAGITISATAADAAAQADVVITMLQNGKQVHDVYTGTEGAPGVLAAAKPDTLFIDCSTIAVDDAIEAHRLAAEAGHRNVDSPVSGGVVGATAGTLAMMVGGAAADFESAKPVLTVVGGRVVHCGKPGAGQAAKVCNNMLLAVSMIAVSEAFVLGESLGLTDEALFEVASNASGQCWALTTNCPVPGPVPASPANRDFAPGFSTALMAKDLGLAAAALQSTGVDAELGTMAGLIYSRFAESGGAGLDFSAIITEIRARSAA